MKMPVKAIVLSALMGLVVVAIAFQQATYPAYNTKKTLWAENDFRGKKAPEFFVEKWLNASNVDTRGKVVIIDFWATWCGPCKKLIPEMNGFAKKFKDKVVVIGISDEAAGTVKGFMKTNEMDYNIGVDTQHHMFKQLGVKGIPHLIIISPDGIVRWQGFPLDDDDRLTEGVIQQIVDASGVK